jgi:hypothetical protein
MNPNAKPFSFSASASSWAPPAPPTMETTASTIAPSLFAPTETPTVEEVVEKTADLTVSQEKEVEVAPVESNEKEDKGEEDEDALDENDPLWIATLKVSNGDRQAALRLLDDPDALMAYPEIVAIMELTTGAGDDSDEDNDDDDDDDDNDDWESNQEVDKKSTKASTEGKEKTPGVFKPQKPGKKAVVEEEEEEVEVDPREHMNIVFIGHVDAGKSTLSGSILYLMGKVDARTIERFEKEAKNRNRESWFLAFIMDTSEEERAKGKTVEVSKTLFSNEMK